MVEKIYSLLEISACYYCKHKAELSEHDGADLGCSNKESPFYRTNRILPWDVSIRGCEKFNYDTRPIDEACLKQMPTDSFY